MRNTYYYAVAQTMTDIEAEWERRKVTDATAEEEWGKYESCLYALTEWIYGGGVR